LPFAINLVANLLFMPFFSGLRSVQLGAADIVIVWATIIWCVLAIWPHYRWVAFAQGPYTRLGVDCRLCMENADALLAAQKRPFCTI
jgi:hypothetical protein